MVFVSLVLMMSSYTLPSPLLLVLYVCRAISYLLKVSFLCNKNSVECSILKILCYYYLYFRTPLSLIAGLMWIGLKNGQYFLRHVCQDSDELSTFGWTAHNGRDYGHQALVDHGLFLTTGFIKDKGEGSGYGGDWAVRLDANSER